MIWNPQWHPARSVESGVERLVAQLCALCGPTLVAQGDQLDEVAVAVEMALAEQAADGRPNGDAVVDLAAQALRAIGETRAAERLGLLRAGVIRPVTSQVAEGATMWLLDFSRLCAGERTPLEMQIFSSLDMILDCIADVWDDSGGRGVLGLQHVEACGRQLGRGRQAPGNAWEREVLGACAARLKTIGRQRGWTAQPEVMAMNLRR